MDSRYSGAAGPHLPHLAAWQDKLAIGGEDGDTVTLHWGHWGWGHCDTGTLVTQC